MKSHFEFSKGQRNGIFLLFILILVFQSVYFFVDFSSEDVSINQNELQLFQKEVDSLKRIELENWKPKIFPFNPNYITDYKGYTLGMSNEEIDRLLEFRAENKWINSARHFQNITKVSDSLFNIISPHFKFPDWITNSKPRTTFINQNSEPNSYEAKFDLNKATISQLRKINGVGVKLSERIVKYRDRFKGGFIADVQLQEVYGLMPEVIERITNQFTVKTPRQIIKLKLNTASKDELVTIQYIDYEIAYEIIEQRTLKEGFKSLDELTKVKGFPIDKIEIIKLYLALD